MSSSAPTTRAAWMAMLSCLVCLANVQWVAHAGLDPTEYTSGSSVKKRARISKVGNRNLRRALYMPALVASQHETHIRAFYEHLLDNGKLPLQALVAVMRKLLHAIFGMFKSGKQFEGEKFYKMT